MNIHNAVQQQKIFFISKQQHIYVNKSMINKGRFLYDEQELEHSKVPSNESSKPKCWKGWNLMINDP